MLRSLALLALSLLSGAHAQFTFQPTTSNNTANVTWIDVPQTVRAGDLLSTQFTFDNINYDLVDYAYDLMTDRIGNGSALVVVDVISFNAGGIVGFASYGLAPSISAGQYYIRGNLSLQAINQGPLVNQTTITPAIAVTSASFTCVRPSAFVGAQDSDDPNFRTVRLTQPPAGAVFDIPMDKVQTTPTAWVIGWEYRDGRNNYNEGIDDISVEFVRQIGSSNGSIYDAEFGSAQTINPSINDGVALNLFNDPLGTAGLSPGEWRIRVNYTNVYEPGRTLTAIGPPFYIEGYNTGATKKTTKPLPACFGVTKSSDAPVGIGSSRWLQAAGTFGAIVAYGLC